MAGIFVPWLADAARLTGWPVVELAGWRTRGHGGMASVEGVVLHHTAGPRTGEYPSLGVVRDGRAGLAGPLSQLGLGRSGTVYVIAAGAAWHAGESRWLQFTGLNSRFLGIEAEDDGDGSWTDAQLDCYPRLAAAVLHYMRRDAGRAAAHREVALPLGRKPDPAGIDMPTFRRRVAELLVDAPRRIPRTATPTTAPAPEDDMFTDQDRALLQQLARRADVGHARDQILSRLGVPDPAAYPAKRAPEDLARDDPARRADVGHALERILAGIEALATAIRAGGLDPAAVRPVVQQAVTAALGGGLHVTGRATLASDAPAPASTPEGTPVMIRFREPALTATTLLAPAVGLALLFLADLPAGAQAGWNALAIAAAGLITSALVARDRLAPAILGAAQALLQLLAVYGFGLTAEQATGVLGFLALLVGAYVRTQVTAGITVDGQVVSSRTAPIA